DVVEVVAAPAGGQAPDVGPLAVAVLELGLRLVRGLGLIFVVRVALLGKAEVDERTVPGVAEGHDLSKSTVPTQKVLQSPIQAIAHADDRRTLLGGDREVLRRTHRKLPQTVL